MTDPNAQDAAPPVVVNDNPVQDQAEAGFRLAIVAAGAVLGALGYEHAAGKVSALLLAVGPMAALAAYVWGIVKTGTLSSKASFMAKQLPNSIARTK